MQALCVLMLLSTVSSMTMSSSMTMTMDGQSCTLEPSNYSSCSPGGGWKASVSETSTDFVYTFAFSESQYIVGSWGLTDGPTRGFPPTWFKYTIYSVQPFINARAFPTLLMNDNVYSCNVTTLLTQDNCVGTCTPVDNACSIGKYLFSYDPASDEVTIKYYVNSLTVGRQVATRNNQSDPMLGYIAIVWDFEKLPLVRSDQFGAFY